MTVKDDITIREYLHLRAKRVKDPPCIDKYDEFLNKVWNFFRLRVEAEQYYKGHKYVAFSPHGALPILWDDIRKVWESDGPPEHPITLIAKRNYNDVNSLLSNLRKVLNRVRQKVAIGRVQQVDAHCLRWLTRQPGRTAAEKGGSRQEILGVVRIENYNTLENRVLKDFLQRCIALATMYLRRYDIPPYHDHVNVRAAARFKNLCIAGLSVPEFENVRDIREFPQPNYVLQQDRLYSKIWVSYCEILRQEDVAEKLWDKRTEINDLYERCTAGISIHCSPAAKYCTPLWVNPIDGRKEIIENPIWRNKLASCAVESPQPPKDDVQIIDLTFPWDDRTELVYPHNHRNARPFIQNPHRPSLEPGDIVSLNDILRKRDGLKLQDYFRQLYGILGGSRWIILVPDDWDSNWLEQVNRSLSSVLTRDKVFLLWRSVAAALGMMEQRKFKDKESLVVVDGFAVPFYNAVELRFMKEKGTGRILPQRSSARLHSSTTKGCTDIRFCLGCSFSDQASVYKVSDRTAQRLGIGRLTSVNFIGATNSFCYSKADEILYEGVRRFLKEEAEGKVSYFDEIDALSLVVQSRAEEVEFKTLVEHNEYYPGGQPYNGKLTHGGALQIGATKLSLYLLEGDQRDNEPLKEMQVLLDQKIPETTDIFFEATITPGQGLASVLFKADFLEKPLPLDLTELKTSKNTKARIEREMKRHFPPVMPLVEASEAIWFGVPRGHIWSIQRSIRLYLETGEIPPPDIFAQAQPYWGAIGRRGCRRFGVDRFFDDTSMSPIDKLKRENVFGNLASHRTPLNTNVDWDVLFKRLALDYKRGKNVLRMIAWSYQYDSPHFEFMRKQFYEKYDRLGQLEKMEITFCANNFPSNDNRVQGLLRKVVSRIAMGCYRHEEMRLAYNLMQFHPEAMKGVASDSCEKAMRRLIDDYNRYPFYVNGTWDGGDATKMAGYFIKCMLFMLHRRRSDPTFFHQIDTWTPKGFLGRNLPTDTDALRTHERTRVAFIDYVRGHGTIDGIPLGD